MASFGHGRTRPLPAALVVATALGTLGLALLGGCESNRKRTDTSGSDRASSARSTTYGRLENERLSRTSMALPTGDRGSSSILLEKSLPSEVRVGQPFEYVLTVTNLTSQPLNNVIITDTMPARPQGGAATTGAQAGRLDRQTGAAANAAATTGAAGAGATGNVTINGGAAGGAGTGTIQAGTMQPTGTAQLNPAGGLTWNLGTIPANDSRTIRTTLVASGQGNLQSCTTVSYDNALCTNVTVTQPNLALSGAVRAGAADVCQEVTMVFRVSNTGSGALRDVVLRPTFPDGLSIDGTNAQPAIQVGDLGPNQAKDVTIRARAARAGTYQVNARAEAEGISASTQTLAIDVRQPALALRIDAPQQEFVGGQTTFRVTVSNTGNYVARDTVIAQQLPAGAEFRNATQGRLESGRVLWQVGSLEPGQSRTVDMTLSPTQQGALNAIVTANAVCAQPVSATARIQVSGVPALLLQMVDLQDPVRIGNNIVYEIRVTNQGSAELTNVVITATPPGEMSLVNVEGATPLAGGAAAGGAAPAAAGPVRFGAVERLGPGQSVVWRATFRAQRAGDIQFRVDASSNEVRQATKIEPTRLY